LETTFKTAAVRDADPQPLVVAVPRARPGFGTARIVYVSRSYEVRFFAKSQWVDTPARMLAPLLIQALGRTRSLQPVLSGAGVAAKLRLETEVTALQQEFTAAPSRVRFGRRAQLVDVAQHRVVATKDLEAVEQCVSDDPYGGVVAANQAVHHLLEELASWCDSVISGSARGTRDLPSGESNRITSIVGLP
jgi:cholesterol transport system auxiliary component